MGWTSVPTYWLEKKGKDYDRKLYLDKEWNCENEEGIWEVLKSSMVGSTWYAAIKFTNKKENTVTIFGQITITAIEKGEFYYKEMSEFCGPYQYDCPAGILKLLSPTDNEYALEWRKQCEEKRARKAERSAFFKLANQGRRYLKYTLPKDFPGGGYKKGEVIYLSKYGQYNCRTRKDTWVWSDGQYRWSKTYIDHTCCEIFEEDRTPVVFKQAVLREVNNIEGV